MKTFENYSNQLHPNVSFTSETERWCNVFSGVQNQKRTIILSNLKIKQSLLIKRGNPQSKKDLYPTPLYF